MGIYWDLFITFFKIGLVSFGGGYAMVSVIQQEVVEKHWLTAMEYAKVVTVSQMVPGPIAVNIGTYVGAFVGENSVGGAVVPALFAAVGVALPSFIIMVLLAGSLAKYSKAKQLNWILGGIRPAIIGIMLVSVLFFGKLAFLKVQSAHLATMDLSQIFSVINPVGILIGIVAFILHYRYSFGAIKIILLTGLAGFCFI